MAQPHLVTYSLLTTTKDKEIFYTTLTIMPDCLYYLHKKRAVKKSVVKKDCYLSLVVAPEERWKGSGSVNFSRVANLPP